MRIIPEITTGELHATRRVYIPVPGVQVREPHSCYPGWGPVHTITLSLWRTLATKGGNELPADWQPPKESDSARRLREKQELIAAIQPLLPEDLFLRVKAYL